MAKVKRGEVIAAALDLLDEVGLDALTTRRLAQRLGIESAALYWHFRDKAALLGEMAAEVLVRRHTIEVPHDTDHWLLWFANNARSFRGALLACRDGARLHAGTTPDRNDLVRFAPKVAYLIRVGFSEREALMALLTMSQFTIGCVMEEQARNGNARHASLMVGTSGSMSAVEALGADVADVLTAGGAVTFEFGLGLILDGLRHRAEAEQKQDAN